MFFTFGGESAAAPGVAPFPRPTAAATGRAASRARHSRGHSCRGQKTGGGFRSVAYSSNRLIGSYLFSASSRFINWFATIVIAASCGGRNAVVGLRFADRKELLRGFGFAFVITRASRQRALSRSPVPSAVSGRDEHALGHALRAPRLRVSRADAARLRARCRAASTNCGSFSVASACSGVFVRSRRTAADLAARRIEDVHASPAARRVSRMCKGCGDKVRRLCRACSFACCSPASPPLPRRLRADTASRSARRSSRPATRSQPARSRASSRHPCGSAARGCSSRFCGSFSSFSGVTSALWRYVDDVTISSNMCFTSQPLSMEFDRQPIEQFLVDRRLARAAEILGRLRPGRCRKSPARNGSPSRAPSAGSPATTIHCARPRRFFGAPAGHARAARRESPPSLCPSACRIGRGRECGHRHRILFLPLDVRHRVAFANCVPARISKQLCALRELHVIVIARSSASNRKRHRSVRVVRLSAGSASDWLDRDDLRQRSALPWPRACGHRCAHPAPGHARTRGPCCAGRCAADVSVRIESFSTSLSVVSGLSTPST